MKKVIIYPVDGTSSAAEVVANLRKFFASPLASELVAYVKFNDVLHIPSIGPNILEMARDVVPADVKFFIDLKIGDVSGDEEKASVGTVENTLKRYAPIRAWHRHRFCDCLCKNLQADSTSSAGNKTSPLFPAH